MAVFAVYDTSGIQEFVFASGKFAECKGASALVRSVFSPGGIFAAALPDGSVTEWAPFKDKPVDAQILGGAPAQIICCGGGNAYALFADEGVFQAATERFLKAVLKSTCGMGVAVAAVQTDLTDFVADYKELQRRLSVTKGNINKTAIAGSQSITKTVAVTGEPITRVLKRHGNYVSMSEGQYLKNKANKSDGTEFDDITESDNNFIGVVHADGNNMSDRIRAFVSMERGWPEAVKNLRIMSANISAFFGAALAETMARYDEYLNERGVSDKPEIIRLVDDGEDMTFIMQGKYAVSFAAEYLRQVDSLNASSELYPFPGLEKTPITACAGVALFHSHFPFAKAYTMAEELCGSAKRQARAALKHGAGASFIDFHIHSGGSVKSISEYRRDFYPIIRAGERLYARPLRVSDEKGGGYAAFAALIADMQDGGFPRSKLKSIRSALTHYDKADFSVVDAQIAEMGLHIDDGTVGEHKYAKLGDALEFLDVFENIAGVR